MPRKPIIARVDAGDGGRENSLRADLREALSRWATGVAVVATRQEGTLTAMTVSAFMALSLDPPLIAIALGEQGPITALLEEGVVFGVSILAEDQRRLAGIFADTFAVDRSSFAAAGDPVLNGALAGLGCRVTAVHPAGDHRLVVAAVETVHPGEGKPLLYFARAYHALESDD